MCIVLYDSRAGGDARLTQIVDTEYVCTDENYYKEEPGAVSLDALVTRGWLLFSILSATYEPRDAEWQEDS